MTARSRKVRFKTDLSEEIVLNVREARRKAELPFQWTRTESRQVRLLTCTSKARHLRDHESDRRRWTRRSRSRRRAATNEMKYEKRQDATGWFWEGNIIFFSLTSTVERVLGDFVVCMLFLFARGCSIPFSRRVSVRVRARAD